MAPRFETSPLKPLDLSTSFMTNPTTVARFLTRARARHNKQKVGTRTMEHAQTERDVHPHPSLHVPEARQRSETFTKTCSSAQTQHAHAAVRATCAVRIPSRINEKTYDPDGLIRRSEQVVAREHAWCDLHSQNMWMHHVGVSLEIPTRNVGTTRQCCEHTWSHAHQPASW